MLRQIAARALHRQGIVCGRQRWCSSKASDEKLSAFERLKKFTQSELGQTVIGNFSYCLQLAGFVCSEMLMMRSFLVGGSASFVVYALIQPKKLWVPAMWESTFASIHMFKIYQILSAEKVVLSPDEVRLYGLLFKEGDLDPTAFHHLVTLGDWATYPAGTVFTTQNEKVEHVRLLFQGSVAVKVDEEVISSLSLPGQFIGEQALVRIHSHVTSEEEAAKATATRTCESATVVFEWPMDKLLDFMENDEHSGVLLKAFFKDVLAKLDKDRHKLSDTLHAVHTPASA